jgi:hypothetical protein
MMQRSLLVLCLLGAPVPVLAQGTLSGQGFGYTPGQLSARSRATGGGFGEFDAFSGLNPAAVASIRRSTLYFESSPEFRRVDVNDVSDRTSTVRFPAFGAALHVWRSGIIGLTASTLADRSWGSSLQTTDVIGGRNVVSTQRFRSTGAINDLRLAGAVTLLPSLRVGAGAHVITGQNRLSIVREFDDSTFIDFAQASSLEYSGIAFSAGVDWRPHRVVGVAASYRRGGKLTARSADTIVSTAHVPDRAGAAIRFDGIRGASLFGRYDWTKWSAVGTLGSSRLSALETRELGGGAELLGPRFAGATTLLRAGFRRRDLPFGFGGVQPAETIVSGGLGIPIGRDRAYVDLSVDRASRSATGAITSGGGSTPADVRERAWTIGFGFAFRL